MRKANNFGEVISAINAGKRVTREGWNGKDMYVFRQLPSKIGMDIIPRLQSIPKSVKKALLDKMSLVTCVSNANLLSIRYENQFLLATPDNILYSFAFSVSDILFLDWIILDIDMEDEDTSSEAQITPKNRLTFGEAIEAMKRGRKLTRDGWNGKGMYAFYEMGDMRPSASYVAIEEFGNNAPYRERLALKTVDDVIAMWVPSSSDILSNDWSIVE